MSDNRFKFPIIRERLPKPIKEKLISVQPTCQTESIRERLLEDDEIAKALLQGYDCTVCINAALCEMYDEILKYEKICENFQKRKSIFFIRPIHEKVN